MYTTVSSAYMRLDSDVDVQKACVEKNDLTCYHIISFAVPKMYLKDF